MRTFDSHIEAIPRESIMWSRDREEAGRYTSCIGDIRREMDSRWRYYPSVMGGGAYDLYDGATGGLRFSCETLRVAKRSAVNWWYMCGPGREALEVTP